MAEAKNKTAKSTSTKSKKVILEQENNDGTTKESNPVENQADQQDQEVVKSEKIAKAGKRSAKAIKEDEEKQAKAARKVTKAESDSEVVKKPAIQTTRSRMERAGKKLREVAKLIENDKQYTLAEAVELATKTSPTKFDATVELHINLGVDPRQADQNIRDNLDLPNGTGKTVRVAVLAEVDDAASAKKAGADIAGNEDLLKEIEKGVLNFDILVATPNLMAKLGKFARVLGPKGLMPNPKSGTVTTDVAKAVKQAKAGRVEYRVDSTGIVHLGIGKVSFGPEKLLGNAQAVFASIKSNKPSSIKGNYVKNITVTTSMGPGIKVLVSEL
jgi:large subunit ribosomal protein L1